MRQLEEYGIDLFKKVADKALCVSCVIEKLQQVKDTSHIRPGRRPLSLQVIHSDISQMGEIRDQFRYFITFLTDYIKSSEVKLLRAKGEAFEAFHRYMMRNEKGSFRCNRQVCTVN